MEMSFEDQIGSSIFMGFVLLRFVFFPNATKYRILDLETSELSGAKRIIWLGIGKLLLST